MTASIVSLTPARGGSKGMKRKNLYPVNGKPLLYYVLTALENSGVDERWVSTDDTEIAAVAESYGARVIRRPAEMALDTSPSEEALLHFADHVNFDFLIFAQNTSPFLLPRDIAEGLRMMRSGRYDSVFTATKEHWLPRWNTDATPHEWDPFQRPRRQDMPERFVENGMFYITSRAELLTFRCRYSGRRGIVEIPLMRSFQIDTYDEIEMIECLMRGMAK